MSDPAGQIAAAAADLEARLVSFARQDRLPGAVAGVVCGDELACSTELLSWTVITFKRVAPLVDYLCAAQELEF